MCVAGCFTSRAALETCESRLRRQEDQIAVLEREKRRITSELQRLRQINEVLHARLAGKDPRLLPERLEALYRIASVRILPLFSGIRDEDGRPGAETLYVVLVPRDEAGNVVPVPGRVVLEVTTAPMSNRSSADDSSSTAPPVLGRFEYSSQQVRSAWVSRLFGSGFQFVERLPSPPPADLVRVHCRFETADGRTFEDRQTVRVHLAPEVSARSTAAPRNKPHKSETGPPDVREPHTPPGTPELAQPPADRTMHPTPGRADPLRIRSISPTAEPRHPSEDPPDPGIVRLHERPPVAVPSHRRTAPVADPQSIQRRPRLIPSSGQAPVRRRSPHESPNASEDSQSTSDVWKAREIPVLR
ncbi:MAG: hypothetical protein D6725_01770 [Planctomycetota bacterium]|nr:MAG: hypothetical protein D6725_01770 [Planctomycetota bacterium]